eukprot:4361536-Pyramimonas_sp.AAC.1
MVRREIETKKLLEIVKESCVGRWRAHRAQGVIYRGSSPVIKVLVPETPSEATALQWNYRMVLETGIDKQSIAEAFAERFGASERIQWAI